MTPQVNEQPHSPLNRGAVADMSGRGGSSMGAGGGDAAEVLALRAQVQQYREVLRRIQVEREFVARQKRRRLMVIGLTISIIMHIALIIYLSLQSSTAGHPGAVPAAFDVAILTSEDLFSLTELDFAADVEEPTDLLDAVVEEPSLAADVASAAADLHALGGDSGELLGGSGDGIGGEGGLGGAGGGTTYFGVTGRGTRFAYIVDRSGSMSELDRMTIASRELARSIQALPDYAYFHVVFFSSGNLVPPMQQGWMQATRQNKNVFVRWLADVDASGGTVPRPAFEAVFALEVRPDVIFFMTDGIIEGFTAAEVRTMNSRGKRVVIHTIAFGDAGSEELLRAIARESGGVYRYVPDGGSRR